MDKALTAKFLKTAANVVTKMSKFYKYSAKSVGKRRFTKKDISLFTDTLMTTTDLLTGATELVAKYSSLVLLQNAKSRQKQELLITEREKDDLAVRMKGVRETNKKFIELLTGLKSSRRWMNSSAGREIERHEEMYGSLILSVGAAEANAEKEIKAKALANKKRKLEMDQEEAEKERKTKKSEKSETGEKESDKKKERRHHHRHHHHHHNHHNEKKERPKHDKKVSKKAEKQSKSNSRKKL